MFRKCVPTRVFEGVAEQIRQAIISGEIRPGERLPAQRQLAETFGVGRTTLLAALRVLEESGLIVIRPGARGGAFVTVPSIKQVSAALDLFLRRENASLQDLAEFRAELEGRNAYWAAQRAEQSELDALRVRLADLEAQARDPSTSWPDFVVSEVEMHEAFGGLCHNRVSSAVLRAIETTLARALSQLPAGYADIILRDWHDIIRATAEHHSENAEALMKSHITFFNEILLEQATVATDSLGGAHSAAPLGWPR